MKKLLTFVCVTITALITSQAQAAAELSDNIEVYRGEANLRVTLARLLPLDSNLALVRISGIDHELNGLVIQHDLTTRDSNRRFKTQLHGRTYNTLIESNRWNQKSMTLHLYGQRGGQLLRFDQDASNAAVADELLKMHAKQVADGRLATVQNFDRNLEINDANDELIVIKDNLAKACGKAIDINVNWTSITDEMIKELSIVSYCSNAFDAVERVCSDEKKKAWVAESIDSVNCDFSDELKLKLVDEKLIFRTNRDAPNQSDFVTYNLQNIM